METIIDPNNKFIIIKVKIDDGLTITFKDSLRIFPVSLNELCEIYNLPGKSGVYKEEYNNLSILDNSTLLDELIFYNKTDAKILFEVLGRAQHTFYHLYRVDITYIVSTSSLALKLFRSGYLDLDIPVLSNSIDSFVRHSYLGRSNRCISI